MAGDEQERACLAMTAARFCRGNEVIASRALRCWSERLASKLAPTGWGGYNCSRLRVSLSTANIAARSTREVAAGVIQRSLTVGASLPRELFVAGLKGSRASSLLQGGGYNCSRPRVSLSTANIASRSTREVTSAGAKMMASPVVLTCRPASYSARWTRAPLAPGASPGVS